MKIESDHVVFASGVRGGETLGSPVAMSIDNRDHQSWLDRMGAAPFDASPEPLTRPRPGHADLAGGLKYDRKDLRDILERASARETAARTAVGAVARKLLSLVGIDVFAHVVSIGGVSTKADALSLPEIRERARASDLSCADPEAEGRMKDAIREAAHAGDTLGGVFEVVATGVPPGLGSHVHWDRKLDGRIAQALMSIHAIKAVELGDGIEGARRRGSQVHDPIAYDADKRTFSRTSNHAGGLEGGVTNGQPVVCRASMKPIATLRKALRSVDVRTRSLSTRRSNAAMFALLPQLRSWAKRCCPSFSATRYARSSVATRCESSRETFKDIWTRWRSTDRALDRRQRIHGDGEEHRRKARRRQMGAALRRHRRRDRAGGGGACSRSLATRRRGALSASGRGGP